VLNLGTHSQNLEITEKTEKKEIEMIEITGIEITEITEITEIEMVLKMHTKKKTIDQNKTHKKRTPSTRKEPDPPKKTGEPFKNQNKFAALADEN